MGRIVGDATRGDAEKLAIAPPRNDEELEGERHGEDQYEAGAPVPRVPERVGSIVRSARHRHIAGGEARLANLRRVGERAHGPDHVDRETLAAREETALEGRGRAARSRGGAGILGTVVACVAEHGLDGRRPLHGHGRSKDRGVPVAPRCVPEELVLEAAVGLRRTVESALDVVPDDVGLFSVHVRVRVADPDLEGIAERRRIQRARPRRAGDLDVAVPVDPVRPRCLRRETGGEEAVDAVTILRAGEVVVDRLDDVHGAVGIDRVLDVEAADLLGPAASRTARQHERNDPDSEHRPHPARNHVPTLPGARSPSR